MKKHCLKCQTEIIGRSDKQFCSPICKNTFNNEKRKDTRQVVREIDAMLHRNREILFTILPSGQMANFDKLILDRAGFRWDYFTGTHINKDGKLYKYVYDYAWMDFTTQSVLVVKKI